MSICLAVLASSRKEIVCLTDRKVSFPSFSADHMTLKNEPFVGSCCVLTAGDDTEYIPLILESAKAELKPNAHPREVADAIDDAYHGQIAELIEKRVLKKFHFNCESFQKNGKKLLSEAVYARLCERIDKVNLSLKFLICGFDKNGIGHIFTAGGEQSVAGYEHIGLWAIGEGAEAALSILAFHITHKHASPPFAPLNTAITIALSAKFMAESANSVGEGTFTVVFKHGEPVRFIDDDVVDKMRKQWLKDGSPRLSRKLLEGIPKVLHEAIKPSNSDR